MTKDEAIHLFILIASSVLSAVTTLFLNFIGFFQYNINRAFAIYLMLILIYYILICTSKKALVGRLRPKRKTLKNINYDFRVPEKTKEVN